MMCDMQAMWGLEDNEMELVKDCIDFLMKDEVAHFKECERTFMCIMKDAKTGNVTKDHEDYLHWNLKIHEAHENLMEASARCEQKFNDSYLMIGPPGQA